MKLSCLTVVVFIGLVTSAAADTVAVVAVCPKAQTICNKDNARSVYRIPVQGSICFVPIQQRLAELGVYDETRDDITITCEQKSAG